MDQYGNTTTFNLETVIVSNIKRSDYWERRASKIGDVLELIDEVYEAVDHVEPWMSGNARGVSTAFNLIFRLGQLKPDPREIRTMLDHRDSPYIRAVGFLYLRYVCDPRKLWGWFKQYMHDEEEFSPSPPGLGHNITMGEFARDILLDQFYFETIFPRVPKTVTDEIVGHLKELGLPTAAKGNGGQGGVDRRGVAEPNQRPALGQGLPVRGLWAAGPQPCRALASRAEAWAQTCSWSARRAAAAGAPPRHTNRRSAARRPRRQQ
ncbi:hypothetical protein ABPG77_005499, partial [Micractinium sp. CCAP 211/92]